MKVSKDFVSANILQAQFESNYPMGGDAGHGGRTVIRLVDLASTSMSCRVNSGTRQEASEIEMEFSGDAEFETLLEALKFLVKEMEALKMSHANTAGEWIMLTAENGDAYRGRFTNNGLSFEIECASDPAGDWRKVWAGGMKAGVELTTLFHMIQMDFNLHNSPI